MKTITEYLKKGGLTIIGGRPAMGKTTFALNLAEELTHQNHPVLYCMLEMDKEDVIQKYNYNGSFLVDDTPRQKVSGIRDILQKLKDESNPITTLIIDYLQLMDAAPSKQNRGEEILQILQDLKSMAIEEDITIIATSQLGRTSEKRKVEAQHIDDLRFSSGWEEIVDSVFLLYRPEYYGIYEDEIGETKNRMDVLMTHLRGRHCRTINYEYDKALKNYHKGTFATKYISTIK